MKVEKRWVIRVSGFGSEVHNQWIALDGPSGGYPFITNFWNAKKFISLEEANRYGSMAWGTLKMTKWDIYLVDEIGMQYVAEAKEIDAFEVELAALKKKYGRV